MRAIVLLATLACACATIAENAGGDQNLPTSGAGPFRKLAGAEVHGTAPVLLDDKTLDYRSPSALALGDGTDVALYFVVHDAGGHDVIARSRATDGRTFYGATLDLGHHAPQVLAADQAWEGPDLAHPSVVRVASEIWLYYASNGSIGLAKSTDGLTFTKLGAPVLAQDALGPIDSASVAVLPDGSFDMMLAQAGAIYEATSTDGASFTRAGTVPVLAAGSADESPAFDTLGVADPFLAPRVTAAGRLQVRVFYTGFAAGEAGTASSIGFAARYGATGPLERAPSAVYAIHKNERAPSVFEWQSGSLLYVEQDSSDATYRVLGGAVAPASITLPLPDPYPPSP
ncbi:MAG TPA: exo-alpha-sialidase [Polyangiaceae bacterium]|jgi:hypothetical protein